MLRLVKKHNIDLLGLQETHLHDQGVLDAQAWMRRHGGCAKMDSRRCSIDSWTSRIKALQALFGGSPSGSMSLPWQWASGF